jgi:pimeloyl-ACP methyl ester carboxylesterase
MASYDEKVQIAVDEDHIAGTFITPGTLVPGVLFVHGWGGSQQQYHARAREVAALGCVCLTFNLRGHAETKPQVETVTRETNLRDVMAAYDLLANRRHVDPDAIAVIGSSYGGYLASILSTLRPIQWLGLRAPALYIDTGWEVPKLQLHKDQDLKTYRTHLVRAADNRALSACAAFKGDVLLIQSEHDSIVPPTVLSSYREACTHARSLTYRCIAGADHGLTSDQDQQSYTRLLVSWLTEMFAAAKARRRSPAPVLHHREPSGSVRPETPPKVLQP